jgi:hypothetical protein
VTAHSRRLGATTLTNFKAASGRPFFIRGWRGNANGGAFGSHDVMGCDEADATSTTAPCCSWREPNRGDILASAMGAPK